MEFTWDPAKSARTWRERGFDFAFAARIFAGPTLARADPRWSGDDVRMLAIGTAGGVTLTVVYFDRITAAGTTLRRIISARRSNRRERQAFEAESGGQGGA